MREPAAREPTAAETAAELSQLLEEAQDYVLAVLDERDRPGSRDALDEMRWRWKVESNLADFFDSARDCLDVLTAEVTKHRRVTRAGDKDDELRG